MKKLILLCAVAFTIGSVWANDMSVIYYDTITVADTVGGASDYDTVYTDAADIKGYTYLNFYSKVIGWAAAKHSPMNFTNDTTWVSVQVSATKSEWLTVAVDVLFPNDSGWSALELTAADSLGYGNWARGRFIHRDSTEADAPDSVGLLRAQKCELWLIGK